MWHTHTKKGVRALLITVTLTLTATSLLKKSILPIAIWTVGGLIVFGLKQALESTHLLPHRQEPNLDNIEVNNEEEQPTVTTC